MKDEALKLALEALEKSIAITMANIDLRNKAITAIKQALAAQPAPVQEPVALEEYDAGLLNDYGGGNVEWWQDYIRAELGRAYHHYLSQITTPPAAQPAVPDAIHPTDLSEHPQYIEGWNDCRAEMLKGLKP
jgi:hypothetical protein